MKVLGTVESGYKKSYIVEIAEEELKRAFEKGYDSQEFHGLKVGQVVDLSGIPDQRDRINRAVNAMTTAYAEFVKAAPVMAEVARIIGSAKAGQS